MHEQQSSVDGDGEPAIRDPNPRQSQRFHAISIVPPDDEEDAVPAVVVQAPSHLPTAPRKSNDEKQDFEFLAIVADAPPRTGANSAGFVTVDDTGYHVNFKPAGKQPAALQRRVSYSAEKRQIQATAGLNMREAVYIVAVGQEKFGGIKLVSETSEEDKIKLYVAAQTHHLRVLSKKLELGAISAAETQLLQAYVQNPDSIPAVKFQVGNAEYIPPAQIAYTDSRGTNDVTMALFLAGQKHALAQKAAALLKQESAVQCASTPLASAAQGGSGEYLQVSEMRRNTVQLTVGTVKRYLSGLINSGQIGRIRFRNAQGSPEVSGRIIGFTQQLVNDLGNIQRKGAAYLFFREVQPSNIAAQIASIAASVGDMKQALDDGKSPREAAERALDIARDYDTPLPSLGAHVRAFVPVGIPAAAAPSGTTGQRSPRGSITGYQDDLSREARQKMVKERLATARQDILSSPPSSFMPESLPGRKNPDKTVPQGPRLEP